MAAAMAKVVTLHGARPGGWSKDRWRWLGAVRRDGTLSPMARLLAHALGFGFANGETAECRPGLSTLAEDCATSERTIDRCLTELQARGWIERKGGNAPGVRAAIGFRFPGRHTPDLAGTHAIPDAPPRPPYKDQPNMNHKKRPSGPPEFTSMAGHGQRNFPRRAARFHVLGELRRPRPHGRDDRPGGPGGHPAEALILTPATGARA